MSDYTPYPPAAWNPDLAQLVDQETYYVTQTWARSVQLDEPPPTSSGECLLVAEKVKQCTADRLKDICEQNRGSWLNVVWPLIQLLPGSTGIKQPEELRAKWPAVWEMVHSAVWDLQPGLYQLKTHFMRGRPTHDCGIQPLILLPGHPSYPGGHAAQAHTAALLLGQLFTGANDDPRLRGALVHAAQEVALNRVYAGVHYPSDSEAGFLLAVQFVALLKQNSMFIDVMDQAAQVDLKLAPGWDKP